MPTLENYHTRHIVTSRKIRPQKITLAETSVPQLLSLKYEDFPVSSIVTRAGERGELVL